MISDSFQEARISLILKNILAKLTSSINHKPINFPLENRCKTTLSTSKRTILITHLFQDYNMSCYFIKKQFIFDDSKRKHFDKIQVSSGES